MSNETGLAAVHEAAGAISRNDHDAAVAAARAEGLAAGRAEGLQAGNDAGAVAERTRLAGIDAHAIPGHEALVASCKADSACTPDMAAGRILAAEKALRANQLAGIQGVETHTGTVAAAVTQQPAAAAAEVPQNAEGWKAEFAKSAKLQSQHESADAYANFMLGVTSGRVHRLDRR